MQNVGIPKLIIFQKLIKKMNDIYIGELHDVRKELCDGLEKKEKVHGSIGIFYKFF